MIKWHHRWRCWCWVCRRVLIVSNIGFIRLTMHKPYRIATATCLQMFDQIRRRFTMIVRDVLTTYLTHGYACLGIQFEIFHPFRISPLCGITCVNLWAQRSSFNFIILSFWGRIGLHFWKPERTFIKQITLWNEIKLNLIWLEIKHFTTSIYIGLFLSFYHKNILSSKRVGRTWNRPFIYLQLLWKLN